MTRDDIIRMACDAGFYFHDAGYAPILHTTRNEYSEKCFERFAALVAAAEREACFQIAITIGDHSAGCRNTDEVAAAIRAKGGHA